MSGLRADLSNFDVDSSSLDPSPCVLATEMTLLLGWNIIEGNSDWFSVTFSFDGSLFAPFKVFSVSSIGPLCVIIGAAVITVPLIALVGDFEGSNRGLLSLSSPLVFSLGSSKTDFSSFLVSSKTALLSLEKDWSPSLAGSLAGIGSPVIAYLFISSIFLLLLASSQ